MVALHVLLIGLFIGLTGLFSGLETGAYRINRARLRLLAAKGVAAAQRLEAMFRNMPQLVALTLVAQNLSVDIVSALATGLCKRTAVAEPELVATVVLAPILLVCAEITPKELFRRRADVLMLWAEKPLRFCALVLTPVVWCVQKLASLTIRKVIGERENYEEAVTHPGMLAELMQTGAEDGEIDKMQQLMAQGLVAVRNVPVSRVMRPLRKVVMISEDASADTARRLIRAHPYSRIPVYSKNPSNIVGILNVLDFLCEEQTKRPADLAWEPVYIEKGTVVADALYMLQQSRRPLGVIVHSIESKTAVGVVTVKDLVEELIGELSAW